jgi:dipeptidyl aminopeptidase/acylaminoacyl peptidase
MTWTDFEWLTGAEPSPDGRSVVCVSDASGRPQPWVSPLGGTPRHVEVAGSVRRCVWRPDGARLLVLTDPDGGEDHRLAEVDPATGEVVWLVAEEGVRCEIGTPYGSTGRPYSPDGALLAYANNARDREVFDVLVRDLRTGDERIVLRGDDRYLPMGFSPDARLLLVLRLHQNTEQDLFACDLATDEVRLLTPHDGPAKYHPVAWLPDSSGVHLCTTQGRDFLGLATLSLDGGLTWIDTPEADVEGAALSPDGTRLAWGVNEDGYTRLRWADVGGRPADVTGLPRGVSVAEFGFDGFAPRFTASGELLVQLARPDGATDLFLVDLNRDEARRLTDCGARLPGAVVPPTVVRTTSADGETVPCLLYRPPSASAEHRAPVVVTVHGGPEFQAKPGFDPLVQALLARGIGVLAPNIRGSSGYGMRYQRLIYRDWAPPARAQRVIAMIEETLKARGKIRFEDVQKMQGDVKDLEALELKDHLLRLLAGIPYPEDPRMLGASTPIPRARSACTSGSNPGFAWTSGPPWTVTTTGALRSALAVGGR